MTKQNTYSLAMITGSYIRRRRRLTILELDETISAAFDPVKTLYTTSP